jgi:hypothetical protein
MWSTLVALMSDTVGAAGDSGARKPLSVAEQILYFRPLGALSEHIVLIQCYIA